MRNVLIVIKHEILTTLSKPSFWVMTFLFPALILGINVITQITAERAFQDDDDLIPSTMPGEELPVIGYVDLSGLIRELPAAIPPGMLRNFPDEASAQEALRAGELRSYVVISPDYLKTGDVFQVENEFRLMGGTNEGLLQYFLAYNLLQDENLTGLLVAPTANVQRVALGPESGVDQDNPLTFLVPFVTLFIFFFLLTMSSGFMLQSVTKEKENRTVELLLLSLQPRQFMLGKVAGLSVIALFQMIIWMGGGLVVLERGKVWLEAAADFSLPPGFVVWAVLYFLLGYLLYGSLMGAIGALAPNARESGQISFIVLFPLMLPLFLNAAFTQAPNGALAVFLSLFPLTAPTAMMTRLAAGGVPFWHPVAGLIGLAGVTYLFVLLAARFFRADTLLSTAAFDWKRVIRELRHQGKEI